MSDHATHPPQVTPDTTPAAEALALAMRAAQAAVIREEILDIERVTEGGIEQVHDLKAAEIEEEHEGRGVGPPQAAVKRDGRQFKALGPAL